MGSGGDLAQVAEALISAPEAWDPTPRKFKTPYEFLVSSWRAAGGGPVLDAAIWAENVPFAETRDYVKKVLANTTVYAALISGKPQSLKTRLGTIGPRDTTAPAPNTDLP